MTLEKKHVRGAAFVVVMAAAALLLSRTLYVVEGARGVEALCNEHECQVFVGQGASGWAVNGFQYLGGLALNILGAAYSPTHHHARTLVLRITPDSIEQYTFDEAVGPLEFYKGTIYVRVLGGKVDCLCRWTGRGYERLTAQESATLDEAIRTGEAGLSPKQDWSRYYLNLRQPVAAELDGAHMILDLQGSPIGDQFLSITGFQKRVPQTTWQVSEKQHRVSRDEYYRIFGPDPERYRIAK